MAELKVYDVEIGGVNHTLQLSKEDAERYGAAAVEIKSKVPANKARSAVNKES